MSDEEINKAVKEAAEFEAQDKARKEAVDTRNEADSLAMQVEKAMSEAGDKLDAADKAEVEADLNALKAILPADPSAELSADQIDQIKAAKEKLMGSSQKVFTKMYEQASQQAGQGNPGAGYQQAGPQQGPANGSSHGSADHVVDGDYTEV